MTYDAIAHLALLPSMARDTCLHRLDGRVPEGRAVSDIRVTLDALYIMGQMSHMVRIMTGDTRTDLTDIMAFLT
jgi:hypothetical protein